MLLFVGCLLSGGAVMVARKVNPSAHLLSLVMSVLSIGAVVTDTTVASSGEFDLVLMIVAPFVVFIYSVWGMLFYKARRD